jgi:molybdenum cofactor cytidylyltransferase
MKLSSALRLGQVEVIALVGGGGKSSAMFRLAAEIVAAGGRVITTTTTRIFEAQIALAPAHFIAGQATPGELSDALDRTSHVLITGAVDAAAGKAMGVSAELIPELQNLPGRPTVIIEADGSRMRPFKAPAEHEPVIPPPTTLVVAVVGADALGRTLSDDFVHRAALAAELAGVALGVPVTPEIVARVLAHPAGGLKNVPHGARVAALINKVESDADLAGARETADLLLQSRRFSGVVLGHVRREPPVVEVRGRVAAVVLAAGQSSRMGRLKQVMPWGDGGTLIGEVVRRLQQAAGISEIVVVTGRDREQVESCVAAATASGGPRVRTVFNPMFDRAEMARSLQAGLDLLADDCLVALVALGDQPQLRAEVVAALIGRWHATQALVVAPFYQGRRGNPVLLDQAAWPLVRALPDDANPRQIFQAAGALEKVDLDDDTILSDLDTPEDYAREVARSRGGIISPHGL